MTIYVNGNSTLPGNGSREQPYRTIQEAAERVLPGPFAERAGASERLI